MQKPEIVITNNGFVIVAAKSTDPLSLDEVRAIAAYKLDELTTDLICCDIVIGAGEGEQIRTIHEELLGINAAMKSFEALPGFNRQWRDAVVPTLRHKPDRHLRPGCLRLTHSQTDSEHPRLIPRDPGC